MRNGTILRGGGGREGGREGGEKMRLPMNKKNDKDNQFLHSSALERAHKLPA